MYIEETERPNQLYNDTKDQRCFTIHQEIKKKFK